VNKNLNSYILQVIVDEDSYDNLYYLIEELEKLDFNIEKKQLGRNIIQIPPEGGILLLNSKNFEGKTNLKDIKKRIDEFYKFIPNGVIVFENFNRIGENKRDNIREILLYFIFNPIHKFNGIIPTRNPIETAFCIKSITKREQIEDIPPKLSRVKRKSNYLSELQIFFIEGLLQCGSKKAKKLLEVFDTPQEIFNTIIHEPDKILQIKGFGDKFIEANKKLLQNNLKYS